MTCDRARAAVFKTVIASLLFTAKQRVCVPAVPLVSPSCSLHCMSVKQMDAKQTDAQQTDAQQTDAKETDVKQTDVRRPNRLRSSLTALTLLTACVPVASAAYLSQQVLLCALLLAALLTALISATPSAAPTRRTRRFCCRARRCWTRRWRRPSGTFTWSSGRACWLGVLAGRVVFK